MIDWPLQLSVADIERLAMASEGKLIGVAAAQRDGQWRRVDAAGVGDVQGQRGALPPDEALPEVDHGGRYREQRVRHDRDGDEDGLRIAAAGVDEDGAAEAAAVAH